MIRWQGQKQRDELEGSYSNPGVRRCVCLLIVSFMLYVLCTETSAKGPFWFIFQSLHFFPPCGSNFTQKGKR